MNRPKITVIGLCGRSVFLELDHFHKKGETVHAKALHTEPGGKGYNQAVAAARLGAEVSFIGCCGEDEDAEACRSFLLSEGITPLIQTVPCAQTAYAAILTDASGENRVTVFRGAADCLSPEFIKENEAAIARSDYLLLNFEYPMAVNETAAAIALEHEIKIILNPAPACSCSEELLKRCWCVIPNEHEAAFLPLRPSRCVTTLGGKGCEIFENGKITRLQAFPAIPADTTGAGDCFCAALTLALGEGKSLEEAAKFASLCAARSVAVKHVMPSLPRRAEIGE